MSKISTANLIIYFITMIIFDGCMHLSAISKKYPNAVREIHPVMSLLAMECKIHNDLVLVSSCMQIIEVKGIYDM